MRGGVLVLKPIVSKETQSAKAFSPIVVMFSGMKTAVSESRPESAFSPMEMTGQMNPSYSMESGMRRVPAQLLSQAATS